MKVREVDTGPHLVPTAGPQITRLTFQYHTSNHKDFNAGSSDEKMLDTVKIRVRVSVWDWVRDRGIEIRLGLGLVNSLCYGKCWVGVKDRFKGWVSFTGLEFRLGLVYD